MQHPIDYTVAIALFCVMCYAIAIAITVSILKLNNKWNSLNDQQRSLLIIIAPLVGVGVMTLMIAREVRNEASHVSMDGFAAMFGTKRP